MAKRPLLKSVQLTSENDSQLVFKLYKNREHTVQEICQMMGISKPTLYQYLREVDGEKSDRIVNKKEAELLW
jgi:predicted transcriptional regulator